MTSICTRNGFFETEEGRHVKEELQLLAESSQYNTASIYSANSLLYPDNLIPFVDRHMDYLVKHPLLEPSKYLANLKLMTRIG